MIILTEEKQLIYTRHIRYAKQLLLIVVGIFISVTYAFAIAPNANIIALPAIAPTSSEVAGATGSAVSLAIYSNLDGDQIWTANRYSTSQTISRAYGSPIRVTNDFSDEGLSAAAIEFVRENAQALGFNGTVPVIRSIATPPNYKVVSAYAELNGFPVYDTYVILSINAQGKLALLKARGFGNNVRGSFSLSEQHAVEFAREALNATEGSVVAEQIYYPITDNDQIVLLPAYEIKINTPNPAFQPTAFVNATNGSLLAAENRVDFVDINGSTSGTFHPMYGLDDPELGAFPYERINLDGDNIFSDENGDFMSEVEEDRLPTDLNTTLRGHWANVQVWDANRQTYDPQASYTVEIEDGEEAVEIVWDDETSIIPERDLFYHVNRVHTFWKELVPDWEEMDYPILAVCNLDGFYADNAFSSAQGIFFGRGDTWDNVATYADVVYHEYSHSVTRAQYGRNPLPYQGESGALNEAWSDYFTCSFTNEPRLGEGGLLGDVNRVIRNIDNDLMYPDDIVGQVHADSRIISAAMWHTREVLGEEYCDLLFHNARFHYARDFENYLMDVIITDDNNGDLTDGTPNYEAIYDAFGRHGIYPLGVSAYGLFDYVFSDEVEGAEGNGDGILDPGETIGLSMVIFRGGRLEGQEGEETIVRMSSSSESIDITSNDIVVPDLALGSSAALPEPIIFEISEEAETSFAELIFSISSDGENFVDLDTMRVIIGRADLLIVRDGFGGFDRTQWIRDPLDELSLIYAELETTDNQLAGEDYFNSFQSIICFSGDARDGLLAEEYQTRLANYMDQGGNVLLTGQHFDEVDEGAGFIATYFGAVTTLDSVRGVGMSGVDGDPISSDMQLILGGSGSATNQRSPGAVEAIGGAEEIFYWLRIGDGEHAAGVRMELDEQDVVARTVFLAFGLEAVGNGGGFTTRVEFTESILRWFEHPLSVGEQTVSPVVFHIGQAYPNPYNSRINFPFSLTKSGPVELKIYDTLGRLVFGDVIYRSGGSQLWSLDTAGWGAGVYFVNLNAEGKTHVSRISFVK